MTTEVVFKVVTTVVFTVVWAWSVRWLWVTQIDPKATFAKWAAKPFEAPSWVATRDPKKIYQNGAAVADVIGAVKEEAGRVTFEQIANAGELKSDTPLEYHRYRLRVVRVYASYGLKSVVSDQGSRVLTGVLEGVDCEVVKP